MDEKKDLGEVFERVLVKYTPAHFVLFIIIFLIIYYYLIVNNFVYFMFGVITTIYLTKLFPRWFKIIIQEKKIKSFKINIKEEKESGI